MKFGEESSDVRCGCVIELVPDAALPRSSAADAGAYRSASSGSAWHVSGIEAC